MKLETFFDKFDQFADAPNAVAKFRELILNLAVQGELVDRIVSDGSGLNILEKAGVSEVLPADLPALPDHWVWARLGSITTRMDSGWSPACHPYPAEVGAWGVLKTTAVQTLKYLEEQNKTLPTNLKPRREHEVLEGDILFTRAGPMNRVGILCVARPTRRKLMISDKIIRFKLISGIDPDFAALSFNAGCSYKAVESLKSGMAASQVNISQPKLRSVPIPLPPLAEQKRIVAKVGELMALCDRLEQQQQERHAKQVLLSHASLARFALAPTTTNLSFLFHETYTILPSDLRKSILTLAVQGKLVSQNPRDESAFKLIGRLSREMTTEMKRRQADTLPPLPPDSLQYYLPEGWIWSRFRDVAIIASNLVNSSNFLNFTHLAPNNIEKGNGVLLPCVTVREDKVLSSNHRFFPGQIIYSKIRPNLAKVVIVDFEGLCSADMYPIYALIDTNYLHRYMLSESFLIQAVKADTRVAMPKINQAELNAIAVPVPPLAEQRRIVAKVDQLVALVDQLETQLNSSLSTAEKLMEALVAELASTE